MLELIVFVSCAYGQGCSQVSSNYLQHNPDVAEQLETVQRQVLYAIPYNAAAILGAAVNGKVNVPLAPYTNLQVKSGETSLNYIKEF